MFLQTINEQDPIYQFCEYCVSEYLETFNDDYILALTEATMSDDEAIKILRAEGKDQVDVLPLIAKDAVNLSSNPFIAAKKAYEMSDFPSRAQGIGVHQPQNLSVASLVFWGHPNTQRFLKGAGIATAGLATLYKINEYRNAPKTVVAKKIASLRKILMRLTKKIAGSKSDQEKNILKKVCGKISHAIDRLLEFMQRKTDKLFYQY